MAKPERSADVLELAFSLARLRCKRRHESAFRLLSGLDICLASERTMFSERRNESSVIVLAAIAKE